MCVCIYTLCVFCVSRRVRYGRRTATFCFVDRLRGDARTRNTRATTAAAAAVTIHVRGLGARARSLTDLGLCPPGLACLCACARHPKPCTGVCVCVRVTVTVKGSGGAAAAATTASVAPTGAEIRNHSPPPPSRGCKAACASRDRRVCFVGGR